MKKIQIIEVDGVIYVVEPDGHEEEVNDSACIRCIYQDKDCSDVAAMIDCGDNSLHVRHLEVQDIPILSNSIRQGESK